MKNLLTLAVAYLLLTVAAKQTQAQTPLTLKAGSLVVLETTTLLSSKDAQVGQAIGLRVKYDVMVNGITVVKAGAPGSGQVTTAEHRKGLGKQGALAIRPSVVQAVDGQMVPLTGTGTNANGSNTTGTTVALAAVVMPLFLLHKGKDASIPAGYELQATVGAETIIQPSVTTTK